MLTDPQLKSKVDALWDRFWSGGIANPITAIESRIVRKDRTARDCALLYRGSIVRAADVPSFMRVWHAY